MFQPNACQSTYHYGTYCTFRGEAQCMAALFKRLEVTVLQGSFKCAFLLLSLPQPWIRNLFQYGQTSVLSKENVYYSG